MFPGLLKQTLTAVSPEPRDCPQTKPITSGGGSDWKDAGAAVLGPCQDGLGMVIPVPVLLELWALRLSQSLSLTQTLTKNNALCRLLSSLLEEREQLIRNALLSWLWNAFIIMHDQDKQVRLETL